MTPNQINAFFDEATYKRGLRYFHSGHVKSIKTSYDEERQLTLIEGNVLGSQRQIYRQGIAIREQGTRLQIETYCDCPVGHLCKHSVAVLLAYHHQQQPKAENKMASSLQAEAWLQTWQQRNLPLSRPLQQRASEALCFELYVLDKGDVAIDLKTRPLKKDGSLSKAKSKRLSSYFSRSYLAEMLSEADKDLLQMLPASDYYDRVIIRNELCGFLLPKLAATGRLFWQKSEEVIHLNPEVRNLDVEWQRSEQGFRPHLNFLADEILLNGIPPFALHLPSLSLTRLNSQLQANELALLQHAPWFQESELCHLFATEQAMGPLTPPEGWQLERLALPMQPILHLSYAPPFIRFEISFLYGGSELKLDSQYWPSESLVSEPKPLIVKRDVAQEQVYLQQILELQQQQQLEPFGGDRIQEGQYPQTYLFYNQHQMLWFYHQHQSDWLALKDQGWGVHLPADLNDIVDYQAPQLLVEQNDQGWLDLSFQLQLPDGETLELLPLMLECLTHNDLQDLPERLFFPHQQGWVQVERKLVQPLAEQLYELFERPLEQGRLRLERHQLGRMQQLDEQFELQWQQPELRQQASLLCQPPAEVSLPQGLKAELRPYQVQGLNWLQHLQQLGFGALLADDMGLGKSMQTLAHLLLEKEQGRLSQPALLIVPTSLVGNWRHEAERFAPDLRVLCLQGDQRQQLFVQIPDHDLVISTYPLLARDQQQLQQHQYSWLILDEAQQVKNAQSKTRQLLAEFSIAQRLALTGTPMENHLGELWSIMDLLQPGLLGNQQQFQRLYRKPIEKDGDHERLVRLRTRISPFILRRTKQQVVQELPDKTEILCALDMGKQQAALYETVRLSTSSQIQQLMANKGLARSSIEVLDALLKLRQVCCDPRLLKTPAASKITESAKLEWLAEQLPIMLDEGRRVLIFSQFTQYLGLVGDHLKAQGIGFTKLTGQTKYRQRAIEEFTSGQVPVFLISLKAGGVGLNLTQADTVIHLDPWWNPAAEQQASDRAYRIGQTKEVFVYKLVISNSLEERILRLQAQKQQLADQLHQQGEAKSLSMLQDDVLAELLRPL